MPVQGSDSSSEDEGGGKGRGNQVEKRSYGPQKASTNQDDPSYSMERAGRQPWPKALNKKAEKVEEVPYDGNGWPMFFVNPLKPTTPVDINDFKRVASHLTKHGLLYHIIAVRGTGQVQMNLGFGKACGNVQL